MSNNDNQPIYRIDGEIYLGHTGRVILPEIPENLIARPTLIYLLQNGTRREHEIQVSYMTSNINWSADYVMVLSGDEKNETYTAQFKLVLLVNHQLNSSTSL